jgi:DHA3 family macrolide efflux protein-like MFS transporter
LLIAAALAPASATLRRPGVDRLKLPILSSGTGGCFTGQPWCLPADGPHEHLARVQGANQVLNGGLRILSAPLGALLLSLLPLQGILAIDVITALIAILPLLVIHIPQPRASTPLEGAPQGRPSVWSDLLAGLIYVRKWPGVLIVIIMAALINLFMTPAFTLLPLLVKDFFAGGAMQLAWMEAAGGIGVILGGLLLTSGRFTGGSLRP